MVYALEDLVLNFLNKVQFNQMDLSIGLELVDHFDWIDLVKNLPLAEDRVTDLVEDYSKKQLVFLSYDRDLISFKDAYICLQCKLCIVSCNLKK